MMIESCLFTRRPYHPLLREEVECGLIFRSNKAMVAG